MSFDWENFTYDALWLQEAVQLEAEASCDIQIGSKAANASIRAIEPTHLQTQLIQVKLQSLVFGELRALLVEADLGVGMEAAFTEGRRRIRARLQQLTPEQHQHFVALITEDSSSTEARSLRQELCSLLDQVDWQQIAQTATEIIQAHLLEQVALR